MYVLGIAANLLSVSKMTEKGLTVVFDDNKCSIYDKNKCKIEGYSQVTASNVDGVYKLDQAEKSRLRGPENCVATSVDPVVMATSQEIWHRRLAHLSRRSMMMMKKGLVTGIDFQDERKIKTCIPYIGKQQRNKFPKGNAKRTKERLELIHSDLCGPMSKPTWGGARYLITFTDDFSRKTFGYLLQSKKQVFKL